ncbi:Fic family protein [uncultured Phocaeicola sp.]|uniref:Fic family protein n=1 Tax=uncultured Phocaeicola sp. TaxID=990718 RepID=UPI00321FE538
MICNNCKDYTSLEELAQRVNKNSKYLQNHILKDMISNNLIERLYPESPRHPNQKYRKK